LKKLCIGTFLNIISQAKATARGQQRLFSAILAGIEDDPSYAEASYQGHLKCGDKNPSQAFIDLTRKKPINELADYYAESVLPHLNSSLQKHIVLAFKQVLTEDTTIPDSQNLCPISGYTKHDILTKNAFSISGLLACLFYYSVTQVSNTAWKASIKEIDKDYVISFESHKDEINIIESHSLPVTPLAATARSTRFDAVFTEVHPNHALSIPNPSATHIYHLSVSGNEFSYRDISKFIWDNIGRYVFSRAQRNSYTMEDIENLTADAIRAYKKRVTAAPGQSHFAEIMLYSFLECALNAPKISSKIELQNIGGTYQSKTSGIHLLPNGANNQVIFGASEVVNDLKAAIDSAFAQISEIKSTANDEYTLIEGDILNRSFDAPTMQYLKGMLIPQKGGSVPPDTAFGLFIGYSIGIPNAALLSNADYRAAVDSKMQADITACIPHIEKLICDKNLTAYSFYIYVLPLNDADNDKNLIMNTALGGEA